jgi:hypothetical protein
LFNDFAQQFFRFSLGGGGEGGGKLLANLEQSVQQLCHNNPPPPCGNKNQSSQCGFEFFWRDPQFQQNSQPIATNSKQQDASGSSNVSRTLREREREGERESEREREKRERDCVCVFNIYADL